MPPQEESFDALLDAYENAVDTDRKNSDPLEWNTFHAMENAAGKIYGFLQNRVPKNREPRLDTGNAASWASLIRAIGIQNPQTVITYPQIERLAEIAERERHVTPDSYECGSLKAGLLRLILDQRDEMRRCLCDAAKLGGAQVLEVFQSQDTHPPVTDYHAAVFAVQYDAKALFKCGLPEDFYQSLFRGMEFAGIKECSAGNFSHLIEKLRLAAERCGPPSWHPDELSLEEYTESEVLVRRAFAKVPKGPLSPRDYSEFFNRFAADNPQGKDFLKAYEFGPTSIQLFSSLLRDNETMPGDAHQSFLAEKFITEATTLKEPK